MIIRDKEKLQILTFKELELLDCDMFAWKYSVDSLLQH